MRGLIAARTAVMTAVAAIDTDMRRMTRASSACRRLITSPGLGQLTVLAFVLRSTIPRASADRETSAPTWAWSQERYQSGEVDYTGSISKCEDAV